MKDIRQKLKNLPQKPGVYMFRNSQGEILYVGKAVNLKNRVRSYFQENKPREARIARMISEIADLEFVVVSTEVESLILENNFIKRMRPRYNVRLRDDKNFQFLKIDFDSEIPQIYPVRKIDRSRKSRAKYFGPYTHSVRPTLKLLSRVFRLCQNRKITGRACFAYHLGRCPGVCMGKVSLAAYRRTFDFVEEFLRHQQSRIMAELKKEMKAAAAAGRFEKAAIFRDRIRNLEMLWERQAIVSTKKEDEDILGIFATDREAVINLFRVRSGRLIEREKFSLEHANSPGAEILENFLLQYYAETSEIPKTIVLPEEVQNKSSLELALAKIAGAKISLIQPIRGKKAKLVKLANENAKLYFERDQASFQNSPAGALADLQKYLHLPNLPERIEGYDISNIQGTNPVGSMVVFAKGRPDKDQYRKFKIKSKETPDDYAMMKEMLIRRFNHIQNSKKSGWPLPDLIVIDGGKGQLNAALAALKISKEIQIIGLAKKLEEIFLPGEKKSLILPGGSPALFLLQQIRDEAHRFAVTFHRGRRGKAQTRSRLDDIPGVGPVTRKKLIIKFGSLEGIRTASKKDLAEVAGTKLAKKIKEWL